MTFPETSPAGPGTSPAAADGVRFASGPLEDRARYQKLTSDLSAGEKDELEREEAARRRNRSAKHSENRVCSLSQKYRA